MSPRWRLLPGRLSFFTTEILSLVVVGSSRNSQRPTPNSQGARVRGVRLGSWRLEVGSSHASPGIGGAIGGDAGRRRRLNQARIAAPKPIVHARYSTR